MPHRDRVLIFGSRAVNWDSLCCVQLGFIPVVIFRPPSRTPGNVLQFVCLFPGEGSVWTRSTPIRALNRHDLDEGGPDFAVPET